MVHVDVAAADIEDAAESSRARAELLQAALEGRLRGAVSPPETFSFSALSLFEHCPLAYAFKYICGLEAVEPIPAFAFGTAAHRAFELFTRERRARAEAGEAPPTREDLTALFDEAWESADFGDEQTKAAWRPRVGPMLDAFWAAETQRRSVTLGEEAAFALPLDLPDGSSGRLTGVIDRLDLLPDGSIELIDYKTGDAWGPMAKAFDLQLAIYALGCRDALGLGVPRRGMLFFVEQGLYGVRPLSADLVEATRREVGERAAAIRASDFAATPSQKACRWCDFREMCPVVATTPAAPPPDRHEEVPSR